jgi:dCTP deaminase
MSILTGELIKECVADGSILIDPFNPELVQPNSVDLTLGKQVSVYSTVTHIGKYVHESTSLELSSSITSYSDVRHPYLDAKKKNIHYSFDMDESGWLVKPGILYLMHTAEVLNSNKFVTQLNGKSSLARLGIVIHFTAGYGDVGFKGQYTLEVSGIHPVCLYPGMKIAQAVFYTTEGPVTEYKGHYVGDCARGAQPSRSWQQF